MNNLKTTALGGFPATLNDLRWIDGSVRQSFRGIMTAFGVADQTTIILAGCGRTVASGTVTIDAGYVSIAGEICYVPTHSYAVPVGANKEYWAIDVSYDNTGLKTFQNSSVHDTYEIRIGKIAIANPVPAGHTRYDLTETIFEIINRKVDTVPLGVIVMWSGAIGDIPSGYSLCDGSNGTPDLRGRFVIGVDTRTTAPIGVPHWDANYNAIGNTGGLKGVALVTNQIPSHQHELAFGTVDGGEFDAIIIPGAIEGTHDLDPGVRGVTGAVIGTSGVAQAHENRPPYFVLAYIMKTTVNSPTLETLEGAPSGLEGG